MGNEGKGTILRIRRSQYLLYLPVRVADDSMFPLRCNKTMCVRVSFKPGSDKVVIEKWREM